MTVRTVREPFAGLEASLHEFDLSDADFNALRALVHRTTGISLAENKRHLVYGRLTRRLRALQLASFTEYRRLLEKDPQGKEMVEFTNAITTNLTAFFRESHHFEYLRQHCLSKITNSSAAAKLRIWSAGCSTGEEPYSIAMTACETLGEPIRADVRILATDLDSEVLARAARGNYGADRVKDLGDARLNRFFNEAPQPGGKLQYIVKPAVSSLITFKQLNLMHELPMRGPLDAIFCRNVVIYFDKETQRRLFQRYASLQRPGDLLFIGHSENLYKVTEAYTLIGKTVYKRNERSA
jgi:chemotaxis protein methyltransferase CheR